MSIHFFAINEKTYYLFIFMAVVTQNIIQAYDLLDTGECLLKPDINGASANTTTTEKATTSTAVQTTFIETSATTKFKTTKSISNADFIEISDTVSTNTALASIKYTVRPVVQKVPDSSNTDSSKAKPTSTTNQNDDSTPETIPEIDGSDVASDSTKQNFASTQNSIRETDKGDDAVSNSTEQNHGTTASTSKLMEEAGDVILVSTTEEQSHSEKDLDIFSKYSTVAPTKMESTEACDCPKEPINKVTWPSTTPGSSAVSSPLCLDDSLRTIKRNCDDHGKWSGDAPICSSVQKPITDPCPSDLQWTYDSYCVKIFENTTFPPPCPYPDTVQFSEYVRLNLTTHPIWMPLRRTNDMGGIGLISWTELNENYKTPYNICTSNCKQYYFEGSFLDKECLVYHNSTHTEAVRCDSHHAALCVYQPLALKQNTYCRHAGYNGMECKQSDYSGDSQCFCKGIIGSSTTTSTSTTAGPEDAPSAYDENVLPAAEFLYPYQNFLYSNITETCSFGLLNKGEIFVWPESGRNITYTNWTTTEDIDFTYQYGVFSSNGWSLRETIEENTCLIYQIQPEFVEPNITLTFNHKSELFELQLTNTLVWYYADDAMPMVFCFTDADAKTLTYRISVFNRNVSEELTVYTFPPYGQCQSGSGRYWCEAFTYPDLERKSTNTNFVLKNSSYAGEYVVVLKLKDYVLNGLGKNPLTEENLGVLQTSLKNELFSFNTSFYPRIFKICDIDETAQDITINFHLTSSASRNNLTEYETLKHILRTQKRFEFVEFLSVDYCYGYTESINNAVITWPTTPINNYAKLEGYCVSDGGSLVKKLCHGNFVDGATWQPVSKNCSIYPQSDVTDVLIEIIEKNEQAQKVLDVLNEPDKFSAFDVALIAEYLEKFVKKSSDLQMFGQLVNNAMNIPRIILLAAQSKFKATDKILSSIDVMLSKLDFAKMDWFYSYNNFAVKIVNIQQTSSGIFQGIVLHDCNNSHQNCSVTELRGSRNETLTWNSSVHAGVYLSSTLLDQLTSVQNKSYMARIAFALHYNPVLFNEITGRQDASVVFGTLLPEFKETFKGPLTMIFNHDSDSVQQNCSYWKFGTNSYSKWQFENSTDVNGAIYCEYWHLTNLAVIHDHIVPSRVSQMLKNLLEQTENVKKLESLMEISELYEEFTSKNVKQFSDALKNIIINNEEQLEALKTIIKNILKLPRSVLKKSEAVEKLISSISIIVSKINDSEHLENFASFNFIDTPSETIFGRIIYHNTTDFTLLLGKSQEASLQLNNNRSFLTMKYKESFSNEFLIEPSHNIADLQENVVPSLIDNFTNALSLLYNEADYCYVPKSNIFRSDDVYSCYVIEDSKNLPDSTEAEMFYDDIEENAEQDKDDATELLKQILQSDPNFKIRELENVMKNHRTYAYNETDVEIIANILYSLPNTIFRDNFLQLTHFGNVLDYIISFDKKVMFAAQGLYQASDKILQATKNILSSYHDNTVIIDQNNFWLITASQEDVDFGGIFVTKINEQWSTTFLNASNFTGAVIDDLILTITMDSNLLNQIKKFCVVVFYENTLFPSIKDQLAAQPIVKILFPDLEESLQGNISLRYSEFNGSRNDLLRCSFWKYIVNETTGYWWQETEASSMQNQAVCDFDHVTNFALVTTETNITTNLEGILNSTNLSGEQKLDLVNQITSDVSNNLLPVDVYLISQIFQDTIDRRFFCPNLTSSIVSNLFNVPQRILNKSQALYNATDKILYAIDQMAASIEHTFMSKPNFALLVQSLKNTNMIGLIVNNCTSTLCDVLPITNSSSITVDSFSAMVIFSESLVNQIKRAEDARVVLSVFYNNSLFNENSSISRPTTKIFGVYFPGLNESLNGTVSVAHKLGFSGITNNQCAYWKFVVNASHPEKSERGRWKNDVEKLDMNSLTFCNFSHTTHFALLLADEETAHMHDEALTVITNVNCLLSLIGLIGIMLTAMLFEKWRNNTGNKILVNNSMAITLKISMLYISDWLYDDNPSGGACTFTGMVLHYAMLSECCWMLIIAILQFKRFVEVLGGPPKYVMVKALVCGWVFPIIPVLCVIVIDPDNYVNSAVGICYPTNLGLYLGVWLPVLIILVINCVIFVFIMYNIFRKKTECKVDSTNHDILFQWRLALLLFFILGLTWVFGFLAQIKGDVVFVYLFCFTSTLQGFVMFWFFIVFNKSTRFLYTQAMKQWFYKKGILKIKQSKTSKY